jgi:predicted transcriptional regulator
MSSIINAKFNSIASKSARVLNTDAAIFGCGSGKMFMQIELMNCL